MQIKWLKKSIHNVDEVYDFLVKDNPSIARDVIKEIYRSTQRLLDNPALGRPGRVLGTRELILSRYPYLVPYRVKNGNIEILRVFHTKRNLPKCW